MDRQKKLKEIIKNAINYGFEINPHTLRVAMGWTKSEVLNG